MLCEASVTVSKTPGVFEKRVFCRSGDYVFGHCATSAGEKSPRSNGSPGAKVVSGKRIF